MFIDLLLIALGLLVLAEAYDNIVQLDEGILQLNEFIFRIVVDLIIFIVVVVALLSI